MTNSKIAIYLLVASIALSCQNMQNTPKEFPRAEKIKKELVTHGDTRIDNYFWLRDRENEKVLAYLRNENSYREDAMKHTEKLQDDLFQEIKGRIKEQDESVPYFKNGYWYYTRFEEGQEHPIFCRKEGSLNNQEEVMLDVNKMAEDHAYYKVSGLSVSPDNKLLAFGEDTLSRRIYTIRFKNLETGELMDDRLEYTTGSAAWADDNKTVFYTVKDASLRPHKIYRHQLGTAGQNDEEIYHESDETFVCYAYKSKSGKYLMIGSSSTLSNEYRFLPASEPEGDFKLIQKRIRGLEYSPAHFEDHWYIYTNAGNATNFKLMKAPVNQPGQENWEEVIPHRKNVFLENIEIFRKYLVTEERENGLTSIRIMPWDGSAEHSIKFNEETYTTGIGNNPEFDTEILRYGYSSLTTPTTIYDYNMASRNQKLMKRQEVVGGHDPSEYESERIWATAPDGKEVPISLVYKKSLRKKEGNPLLLYGYGSYGATIDPNFSSVRLSLLDRGFVFAIAHIRGGQYLGREWYEDGRMLHKKNSFTDFIACADALLAAGYTTPEHLYAMGGSAGGLLMGAVVNMKPEIFNGVIAAVPFVDVVSTMLDESIPLTTGEYDEWGNPNHTEYYEYIKSYSPYDNVEAKEYPAMLVTTGLHDSQVQYWEPAKWVAKLRELKTDDNPLYLYTNMETGHGGAAGRFEALRETAMEYAFLLDLEGIEQ